MAWCCEAGVLRTGARLWSGFLYSFPRSSPAWKRHARKVEPRRRGPASDLRRLGKFPGFALTFARKRGMPLGNSFCDMTGKKYNVGIIGYGWVAGAHIAAINATAHARVTAVWSSRKLDSADVSARHGGEI